MMTKALKCQPVLAGFLALALCAVPGLAQQGNPPASASTEDKDEASPCTDDTLGQKPCEAVVQPAPPRLPSPASPPPSASINWSNGGATGPNSVQVLSYFQRGTMKLEVRDAFGMVVIPRKALDATEKARHRQFCELLQASLDFVAPEDVTPTEVLATYWPTVSNINPASIRMAFATQDCQSLLLWYDHKLARDIAARTGLQDKSGPLLVTWPSQRTVAREERDPLVVDFSRANAASARRTLAYWFRQVSQDPALWTDHIREGTFRADLADAINETAGVMLSVLSGKWEGLTEVNSSPS